MRHLKTIILFFILFTSKVILSQINYNGINIQGQFLSGHNNTPNVDLDIIILNSFGDTIRHERHLNVTLQAQNSFNLILGNGVFVNGQTPVFNQTNWLEVDLIKVNNYTLNSSYEIGSYKTHVVPFSFHSLHSTTPPYSSDLLDTPSTLSGTNTILKYNGSNFTESIDLANDSTLFSWYTNQVFFADTALYCLNSSFSDSSSFSFKVDSSLYAVYANNSVFSDSTKYADSIIQTPFSINNWGLNGNTIGSTSHFLGTTNLYDLTLRTNNIPRFIFSENNSTYNSSGSVGFNISSEKGTLFTTGSGNSLSSIPYSHLYFDGNTSSFHGGSPATNLDTIRGMYSFSWGENTGTNGRYSTVFGKNSHGDSITIYDAYSSFACGKNCTTTRTGVAIGDNAIAGKYRNVAIGKNVTAGTNNASIGIGNNVLSTGATGWAMGRNVTASGHFSTAIGTNSSTNYFSGSFVYGDLSTSDTIFNTSTNQFMIRAAGGCTIYTSSDLSMGVQLLPGGGSWNMISDSTKKENINLIDYSTTQHKLRAIPIYSWSYKNEPIIHIGPMAQDFNSIYQVGETFNYINMIDIDGVILMGIKGIYEVSKKETKTEEVNKLKEEIDHEAKKLELIEKKIKLLYEKLDH